MSSEQRRLAGRYVLEAPIGRGGMGEVWRGTDTVLGRQVAVKTIDLRSLRDESGAARFEREARATAGLSHPNVVTVHDSGVEGDTAFIVMELLPGPSLADELADGPLPVDEVVEVGRQVASALDAAHARGLVHRDIKPGNIAYAADGRVRVLDFGITQLTESTGLPGAHRDAHRDGHRRVPRPGAGARRAGRRPRRPLRPRLRALRPAGRASRRSGRHAGGHDDDARQRPGPRRARRFAPTRPTGWPTWFTACSPRTPTTAPPGRRAWPRRSSTRPSLGGAATTVLPAAGAAHDPTAGCRVAPSRGAAPAAARAGAPGRVAVGLGARRGGAVAAIGLLLWILLRDDGTDPADAHRARRRAPRSPPRRRRRRPPRSHHAGADAHPDADAHPHGDAEPVAHRRPGRARRDRAVGVLRRGRRAGARRDARPEGRQDPRRRGAQRAQGAARRRPAEGVRETDKLVRGLRQGRAGRLDHPEATTALDPLLATSPTRTTYAAG